MIVIGEKINGAIARVSRAIRERDADYIAGLAKRQEQAGANYLDVFAGVAPRYELEALKWLVDVTEAAVDLPLCLDSHNPKLLVELMGCTSRPGIVNFVSGESGKCEVLLPAIAELGWEFIALTCDDEGIPSEPERKAEIGFKIMEQANRFGITEERVYIDAIALSLTAFDDAVLSFCEAIQLLREKYPAAHYMSGLSNVSYGLPERSRINSGFLTYASACGMDTAIMDPTDRELHSAVLVADALLGKDPGCRRYNRAFRLGEL